MSFKKFLTFKKLAIGGSIFAAGMLFLGGVNGFFAYTNTTEFCTSCHTMQTNLNELKERVHWKSASGVRAGCADCHVPKEFFPKVYAKVYAVKDIYHEIVGTIDTPEKYEARRWQMANAVWDKMRANDSRECRTCHDYDSMDLSKQERIARKKHARGAEGESDKTCIDCHAGIAHNEPDEPDEPEEEVEKG